MKRWVLPFVITGVFAFSSTASASEFNSTNPGVTPDQLLYSVDQLLEDFQLYLTTNSEKETEILLELAKERLAEAQVMTDEEKLEFLNHLMENYVETLALAEEQMAELIIEGKLNEDTLSEFETTAEEVTVINEELEEIISDDLLEELENQQASLKQMPTVVKNLDEDDVVKLREQGLGFGQIAQIYMLSEASGEAVEEISSLFTNDEMGFGEVAKELGLHPSELKSKKKVVSEEPSTSEVETVDSVEATTVALEPDENTDQAVATSFPVQSKETNKQATATATNVSVQKVEEAKVKAEEAKKQSEQAKAKAEEAKKNEEISNQQPQKAKESKEKNN